MEPTEVPQGQDPVDSYYGCCTEHVKLSTEIPTGYGDYIEKLARGIWERKALEQGYDPVLIKIYGERLSQGIKRGFGKDYFELDFDSPDYKMLHSLEKNVWQFSSAKTYSQLKEMSDALRKPDGSLRTFDEFRIQTVLITGKQLRHLKTEYNTAVIGAQMSSKWISIQAQKELYPLLEFIAVEDDKTTPLCRTLNGVIRHVDDIFWTRYYPPNHYSCRSTVKQLRSGDITPDDEIISPNVPEIFKVNLGQRGLAFPEDHAYFESMPDDIKEASRQFFPYNMQFDILEADHLKGIIRQHYLVNSNDNDYVRILERAVMNARNYEHLVDILPTLNPNKYAIQRQIIFPYAKDGKSPDLRINKILWEEEGVTTIGKNTISDAIKDGAKQANHLIINLLVEEYPGDEYLFNKAKGAFNIRRYLKEIQFIHKDKVFKVLNPYKSKGDQ